MNQECAYRSLHKDSATFLSLRLDKDAMPRDYLWSTNIWRGRGGGDNSLAGPLTHIQTLVDIVSRARTIHAQCPSPWFVNGTPPPPPSIVLIKYIFWPTHKTSRAAICTNESRNYPSFVFGSYNTPTSNSRHFKPSFLAGKTSHPCRFLIVLLNR